MEYKGEIKGRIAWRRNGTISVRGFNGAALCQGMGLYKWIRVEEGQRGKQWVEMLEGGM